ncbi:hypothetical protein AUK04_00910 [Candidatus Roizmanbacteria bacterium CG2_30_33_16]|uniref:DUF4342 domain-containing protein n=2 Tax=Candidatus Roizmaniibacteriota TaxID=1752723 RepID=A0A2M8DB33_9BACT|nr:DUF4342 domain-containing protein [Candidatus Roizmanbacteria bacterium]OIP85883.1 MAG: hypothetical protein AUK04_00910 [Candidatus Roizmanbacteria bacterium CG2_30_33_16]PJB87627.1 MAG: hypothetical protein CO083_06035 [Candidatus Roizmanbacteria bacterium CG_4_9_14_0_8_um_filter_34_12]
MKTKKTTSKTESFKVKGEDLLKKIKSLIHKGNIRKISIEDKTGKTIIVLPLTIGAIGAILVPAFAAVGAIAALVSECTIKVEREN